MNKKRKTSKLIIEIVIILLVLVVLMGISYAWFKTVIKGNEDAKTITIRAGKLEITYVDGPELNVQNIVPGWTASKTFTVQNTGDDSQTYKIAWATLENNFINRADLKYSITSTNGGGTLSQTQIPNSDNNIIIIDNITIPVNTIQTYTITIQYLLTQYNQNSDKERTLSGKIEVLDFEDTTIAPQTSTGSVSTETVVDTLYEKTMTDVLNAMYPVGSIYTSTSSTNPHDIIGGEWTRIKDTFLLAAGDTYTADDGTHTTATAGSADAVLVSHSHTVNTYHRHGMGNIFSGGSGGSSYAFKMTDGRLLQTKYTDYQGSTAAPTTTVGESGIGKNMPPYLTVYMWKRTS